MPNEPPTLPVSTRTLSAGAPRMSRSMFFRPNTPWLHECSVHFSLPASNSPIAERGSIEATTRRWLISGSLVTCAALAKASATLPASP